MERARVRVSNGPLVEGAVMAGVEALSGASLDTVLAAADGAAASPKLPPGWSHDEGRSTPR